MAWKVVHVDSGNTEVKTAQGLRHFTPAIGLAQTAGLDNQIVQWPQWRIDTRRCLGHGAVVDC